MFEICGIREFNERSKFISNSQLAIPFTASGKDVNVHFVLFLTLDKKNMGKTRTLHTPECR